MSTEYVVHNANGVEISLNDSGNRFSLDFYADGGAQKVNLYAETDIEDCSFEGAKNILLGTRTILAPEDVVSMALKMMQAALYHVGNPESVKKDIINQVVKM